MADAQRKGKIQGSRLNSIVDSYTIGKGFEQDPDYCKKTVNLNYVPIDADSADSLN